MKRLELARVEVYRQRDECERGNAYMNVIDLCLCRLISATELNYYALVPRAIDNGSTLSSFFTKPLRAFVAFTDLMLMQPRLSLPNLYLPTSFLLYP